LTSGNNNIYIGNQGNGIESWTIRIGAAPAQMLIGIATTNVNGATLEIQSAAEGDGDGRVRRRVVPSTMTHWAQFPCVPPGGLR